MQPKWVSSSVFTIMACHNDSVLYKVAHFSWKNSWAVDVDFLITASWSRGLISKHRQLSNAFALSGVHDPWNMCNICWSLQLIHTHGPLDLLTPVWLQTRRTRLIKVWLNLENWDKPVFWWEWNHYLGAIAGCVCLLANLFYVHSRVYTVQYARMSVWATEWAETVALCCRCQGFGSARLAVPTVTLFFLYPFIHSFTSFLCGCTSNLYNDE